MPVDDYAVEPTGLGEEYLRANPMAPTLGPELAHWAAVTQERITELRREADGLEKDVALAFAGARVLMGNGR